MTSLAPTSVATSLWPALALGMSVAVGNGLGRFAYALLLPSMQRDLALSYAQAGWLNTANALGYVLGAVSSFLLLRSRAPRTLLIAGVFCCACSLAITGLGRSLHWLTAMRVIAGIGAAWVFSCGAVLVQHLYGHSNAARSKATAIFFGGAGVGIMASAVLVTPLLSCAGDGGWPAAWMVLGAAALLMASGSILVARRVQLPKPASAATSVESLELHGLRAVMLSYFCIAAGYIGYVTFVFAWMRAERHSAAVGAGVWVVLGLCITLSPWAWRRALGEWPATKTLAVSSAAALVGVFLCILDSSVWSLLASAVLFGLGVFIAPAAVAVLLSQRMPPHANARAMALFTTIFAVGQALGPLLSGVLADRFGIAATLWPGAALLALATALALAARPRERAS